MDHIEITTTTRQPLPAMKEYMKRVSGWPNGPYLLQVVHIGEVRISRSGHPFRRIDFRIGKTDKMLDWIMVNAEGARWAWQDVVDYWDDIPKLYGRTFLIMCVNEHLQGLWRFRPVEFMAELVEEETDVGD